MQSIVYIGMDVHKDSFSLCALNGKTGEILGETKCASDPKLVDKFTQRIAEECSEDTQFLAGYEAGVLGYSLYYSLYRKGIDCVIMAPTTMYSSSKNKVVKNDKMDAKMIARNLAANTYHAVYVPIQEDIEVKEYVRMRKSFKKALTRAKQQLGALLLREGLQYSATRTKWTQPFFDWVKTIPVSKLLREVIDEYLVQIEELQDKLNHFDQRIESLSRSERYAESIGKLTCFKGIAITSAMTIHIETADFSRFPTARSYMAFLGLTPSEHSSGDHQAYGGITKQGNSAIRTILVESAQSLVRGQINHKSKTVRERQVGQPSAIIAYADKGVNHLQRKYRRMIEQGKQHNVAITAIARELAGFIWGIETGHIDY